MYLLAMAFDDHAAEKRILNAVLEGNDSALETHMKDTAEVSDSMASSLSGGFFTSSVFAPRTSVPNFW